MLKAKIFFEIDNEHINRILGALNLKYDEESDEMCGKYRGKKFKLTGDEAGERIGRYFSEKYAW